MSAIKVYIAAPYERRHAAQAAMQDLESAGLVVTSQWLRVPDELSDADARKDLRDIDDADVLLGLNPESFKRTGTGGRHVELGYAYARGKGIVLVGVRSNIFHYLSDIRIVPNWDVSAIVDALRGAVCDFVATPRSNTSSQTANTPR